MHLVQSHLHENPTYGRQRTVPSAVLFLVSPFPPFPPLSPRTHGSKVRSGTYTKHVRIFPKFHALGFVRKGHVPSFSFHASLANYVFPLPSSIFVTRVVGYAMPVRHERCVEFLKREDSMDRKRSSIWDPRMIQEDRFRGGSAELFPGCSLLIRNVYTNRARRIYIKCIDDRIGLTFASCISLSTVHLDGNLVES